MNDDTGQKVQKIQGGENMSEPKKKAELNFDRLWTYDDLSVYTGIPKSTLDKMVRAGEIPSLKPGKLRLFHPTVIDNFFKKKCV